MRAFSFDQRIVREYSAFSRSFTRIRASDLRAKIDAAHAEGRFWPDSLLSINPSYRSGATAQELAEDGLILPETADVFRAAGASLTFHVHQQQAISKAVAGQSFVVTTGTGSGKSLCFFVPIVDAAIRGRKKGDAARTRAIIVYPMNALANSQTEEIEKFIGQAALPDAIRPTVARYTGQETSAERQHVADNPPDILLTNFMMLELLMTRQDKVDQAVIANTVGLDFIVLDELHTYRGRQGADVAVLVRRLRERCRARDDGEPLCIGTSATMASEGDEESRSRAVAAVSSRIFGVDIGVDAVIDESLTRSTDPTLHLKDIRPSLTAALQEPFSTELHDSELARHPLAVWLELEIGLKDAKELGRRAPRPLGEVATELAKAAGVSEETARQRLEEFLAQTSLTGAERGHDGDKAFMAFKLHRFIAGAGDIRTTLRAPDRSVLFEGQKADPADPQARLYPTRFCRECGQEYHVVTILDDEDEQIALPREIDETPLKDEPEGQDSGYLTPVEEPGESFQFSGEIDSYPEDWLQEQGGALRLRPNRRKSQPRPLRIRADGKMAGDGRDFWFIPGRFGFCLACRHQPSPQARERNKLGGLTAEGRSSATTTIVSAMLQALNAPDSGVPDTKRKTLAFTDNRQDAALQAGHFNDSIFVSLLRGAILRAVLDAGPDGLADEDFGRAVQKALGFIPENPGLRQHWMLDPDVKGAARADAGKALARVLAHRVWADQRRGWRFTYPNLTGLDLVRPGFSGLDELLEDEDFLAQAPPVFAALSQEARQDVIRQILTTMLEGLAVATDALDPQALETLKQRSRAHLATPWAIDRNEDVREHTSLVVQAPPRHEQKKRDDMLLLRAGFRSGLARRLNRRSVLGHRLKGDEFDDLITTLLRGLEDYGIVRSIETAQDLEGWQLAGSCVRLLPGPALDAPQDAANTFFYQTYVDIAKALEKEPPAILGYEAREHTAQVTQQNREWREWRFRHEEADIERIAEKRSEIRNAGERPEFLPVLFCSPTMELGVDISALNAVYLRNVPPTPANYAQRAGRAGRSGQAAVITTYCAAQSPHDQYYFRRRQEMVAGIVRPPALDLANEELIRSHLHAVWLAESGLHLSADIPGVLDLETEEIPLRAEIKDRLTDTALTQRAMAPMRRLLDVVLPHVEPPLPEAFEEPDAFVERVAENAAKAFDEAFGRWRGLYTAAQRQLRDANERSQRTGLSAAERRKVKQAQGQANEQIGILEQGKATSGSDFYTYRYLATEGFLPGYNFPRLPLYAFVPGAGSDKAGAYLQRARFLAISEFGPRSLIYHEGRAFRVHRAKLGPDAATQDGRGLNTGTTFVCASCGAAHSAEVERCHACATPMADAIRVPGTLRIDNVETVPAERISANDEDRQRQGFDVLTVFAWPWRDGRIDVVQADLIGPDSAIASLQYGEGAQISRLNLGLKRRKDQEILGFEIDPVSGRWGKLADEDDEQPQAPDEPDPRRIVPLVQDNKNALLLRLAEPERHSATTITTLHHALLRGIEIAFQLEEGEILADPLPRRDTRRAILLYEATEGGAGVLGRLVRDEAALRRVAQAALQMMHYDGVETAIEAGDGSLLKEADDAPCVHGCYRCLLSYFNQPDHEAIDRQDEATRDMLIAIALGRLEPHAAARDPASDPWRSAFTTVGLPQPDGSGATIAGINFSYVWRDRLVAATPEPIAGHIAEQAETEGWQTISLPDDGDYTVPEILIDALRSQA